MMTLGISDTDADVPQLLSKAFECTLQSELAAVCITRLPAYAKRPRRRNWEPASKNKWFPVETPYRKTEVLQARGKHHCSDQHAHTHLSVLFLHNTSRAAEADRTVRGSQPDRWSSQHSLGGGCWFKANSPETNESEQQAPTRTYIEYLFV